MSTTLMDHFAVVIDAWTQRKDIDAVLAAMTDDVVWYPAVGVMPPMHGKAAVRETLQRLSGQVARSHWHVVRHAEADDCLFLEGVDRNELVSGAVATVPYMGIVEFEAGEIARGPVAKIGLPRRICVGTHACWASAAELARRND